MPEERPAAEQTEQPTQRKLRRAREKGKLPQSEELPGVITLLMLLASIVLMAPTMINWMTMQMKDGMTCQTAAIVDSTAFIQLLKGKINSLIIFLCPLFAALSVGAVMANMFVSGLSFSSENLKAKWEVINPVNGCKKLINMRSLVRLCLAVFKLLMVSLIIFFYIRSQLETLATLRWAWTWQILIVIGKTTLGLMIRICLALLAIALTDVLYQKWKYIQDLKMTKQEVKEELKETEGQPQVKSRIRKIQMQMTVQRMKQEVPKATVVLVNPTHVAVALKYEPKTMDCPMLVAKGADYISEKIREIARAHGVPIIHRPELARTLYATVKPGNPIPGHLYMAVAEVLAMIYRMRKKT
ncbi:MAG: flagellar biosynthesis protein FlhB [Planctomycetota bacterium]|jgi:flagellar biosynthetic protein FlhB